MLWIPLVDCYRTKSMFYLPYTFTDSLKQYLNLPNEEGCSSIQKMHKNLSQNFEFLNISPPDLAIFHHTLWHGNVVNEESTTRWSINLRFKSLFSPYKGKKLGDFFAVAEVSSFTSRALKVDGLLYE